MEQSYNIKVRNLTKIVKEKTGPKVILENANFDIQKGEFVAVVGVSGAGKSTLLNLLGGYSKISLGEIYYNGIPFHENPQQFKGEIGYVPQKDLLYEDLSLYDTLKYSLNLIEKANDQTERKILEVLQLLEIDSVSSTLIRNLSGGEKKRASIAVELLRKPKILYLDEPTSGLDSNIEKKLMRKLKEISNIGKTVFITAHTVSNLYLCDKIIFMGQGGKICFMGTYEESLAYFQTTEFVDIYDKLKENTEKWSKKYLQSLQLKPVEKKKKETGPDRKTGFLKQLRTLLKRNLKLKWNNKLLLSLLLFQAPIMAIAIFIAVEKDVFQSYETAKIILFGLSCAAIWLGMFNSIQEISREFPILKKEQMSSLNFASYIVSKILMLGFICLIQMFLLVGLDYLLIDFPKEGIILGNAFLEYLFEYFLISFSAGCMGIFISSIIDRTETTMVLLPIYMMFQLLFTGILVPLNAVAEKISYFMTARWGMAGFGIIANLEKIAASNLDPHLALLYTSEAKDLFPHSESYLLNTWILLFGIILLFLVISIFSINQRLKKDN